MEAAWYGAQSIVRYLIKNGADVNYHNPINGNTALHMALGRKRLNCLKCLLEAGADRNVPNHAGMTPSDFGKDRNFEEGLEMLSRFSQTINSVK